MAKDKKEVVSFDIVLRLKKTVGISKETKLRLIKYVKSKNLTLSPFIEKELTKWMRDSSGIKSFSHLIKESDLREDEFMYRFNEFLEQLGLGINKNTFSPEFEKRLNKRLDIYEKGRR